MIGLVMMVNSAAGFAVPLLVGRWSDRRHTPRHGRRPFIVGGSLLSACGLAAAALGHSTSFLVLTLAGATAYVGVNVVTTAHRALVHDCFETDEYARGNGAQEVAALAGGLVGLAVGGLLTELALWAPFVLAAVGMPLLAWPTLRWLPVSAPGEAQRRAARPLRFYATALIRPGVRALLAAEVFWVIGYAALPVFFILYARRVLGLEPGLASLWLAAFALGAGVAMIAAGFLRNPRLHKPFLALGVALMGLGFLAAAASTSLVWVSMACASAATGFGLISTLGFSLFASLIPQGEAGGYTALYYSLRAVASALAVPVAGVMIAASGSYRSLFLLGGVATLAALVPLAFAPSPRAARSDPAAAPVAIAASVKPARIRTKLAASMMRGKRLFDFLASRGARKNCPLCGHEVWNGWDERVSLPHAVGRTGADRGTEAFPLTCANCGFIRLQSAHVLDDPRTPSQPTDEQPGSS